MPENFVIRSPRYGDSLCVAILNATGRPFAARMKNFAAAMRDGEQFRQAILVRDSSMPAPVEESQRHLAEFQRARGKYIELDAEEYTIVNAFYDTIVAIEESNPAQDPSAISLDDFAAFLATSGYAEKSSLLSQVAKLADSVQYSIDSQKGQPRNGATSECAALCV